MNQRRGPKIGDSSSLWNFTTSPGWSSEEAELLKLLLMKLGVGRWVQIQETGLLPGKVIQQLYGQTQRLIGQQSLAAYTGLKVDIDSIRSDNEKRADVERKSGLIIWSGPNPTKSMKEKWQKEAQAKYGLSQKQLTKVEEQLNQLILRTKDSRSDLQRNLRIQQFENSVLGLRITELNRQDKLELLRVLTNKLSKNNNNNTLITPEINNKLECNNNYNNNKNNNNNNQQYQTVKNFSSKQKRCEILQDVQIQENQFEKQNEFEQNNPSEMKIPRQKRSARKQNNNRNGGRQIIGVKRKAEEMLNFDRVVAEEVQL